MTPHEQHVLGGQRAIDDAAHNAEPPEQPRWTWPTLAVLAALAFVAGVIVWNVATGEVVVAHVR